MTDGAANLPLIENIITTDKKMWAVSTFAPYKTAGPDSINQAMLQHSIQYVKDALNILFRASLTLKHIPKCWREVRIAFIPKPGKKGYSLPENFRPMSLTSFMLKTIEKLVDRY